MNIAHEFYNMGSPPAQGGYAPAQWLIRQGVPKRATYEPDPTFFRDIASIGKHFDLAQANEAGRRALLILARDQTGPIDIVAWLLETGELVAAHGNACMLGEDSLYKCDWEQGVSVFRHPLSWFRAGRQGIVILSANEAAARLEGNCNLIAEDPAHGLELRRVLTRPAPRIVVSASSVMVAA